MGQSSLEIKYCILPIFSFVPVTNSWGFLIGNLQTHQVEGALYVAVLRQLAKRPLSTLQLIEELGADHPSPHIVHAVQVLQQAPYIEEEVMIGAQYVHRDSIVLPDMTWTSCLSKEIPEVVVVGSLTSEYAQKSYQETICRGQAWLPIVVGQGNFVGPVFKGKEGPCPQCVQQRLEQARGELGWLSRQLDGQVSLSSFISRSELVALLDQLVHWAAKYNGHSVFGERLLRVLANGQPFASTVKKRPECPACGDAAMVRKQMEAPLHLADTSPLHYASGYRSLLPHETWRKHRSHISPDIGILSRFHVLPTLDKKLHVYAALHATIPMHAKPRVDEFHLAAFGKGRCPVSAKVSALCEALERASVLFRGDEPLLKSSSEALFPRAVLPLELQHFHPVQLSFPDQTHGLGPVPQKMIGTEAMDWVPAWSLRDNERRYVPADAVFHGMPKQQQYRAAVFESNGLSAGNTLGEAVVQGLLELIERDAVAIWWFNRLLRPAMCTDCMKGEAWFEISLALLKRNGWQVHFLNLTLDTATPVVAAVGCIGGGYLIGYGSHFDPRLALSRALTELIQLQAIMKPVRPPKGWEDVTYLYPSPEAKALEASFFHPTTTLTTSDLVIWGVSKVADVGVDTIVINVSRPDIGIAVVKVMAPGLRAFRPRFGEGRLYEVPVTLGLLKQRKTYAELNPMWLTIQPFLENPSAI